MPGVIKRYAEGGRTHTPYTGDYYTYGERPEHQFFSGQNPPLNISPGGGNIGIPKTPTGPSTHSSSGANLLTGVIGSLPAINEIGKVFGRENVVKDGIGWIKNALGMGNKLDPRWASGEFGSQALEDMMDPTNPAHILQEHNPTATGMPKPGMLSRGISGVGGVLDILSGLDQGGVKGVAKTVGGADQLAKSAGKNIPGLGPIGAIGNILGADWKDPGSAASALGSAAGMAGNFLGSSALGAISGVLGPIGLGFGAVKMLNQALNGKGDEKRNSAAFAQAFPETEILRAPGKGGIKAFARLPDGRIISADDLEKLSGAWYGATYAPDGDQEGWQRQYDELNAMPGLTLPDNLLKILRPTKMAHGGVLEQMQLGYAPGGDSQYVEESTGASGRADNIPARLSEGEFVMDAETVALLGDGNTDAGAARLEELRQAVRKHKGKALAKGKFSPNAKTPAEYLGEI